MCDPDWNQMLHGLRAGDDEVCREFWRRFGPSLQQVAQRQLSARLQRRVGSEDVVQSACRTFFRRVSRGQFDLPDADALWRLMCAITLTKARRAARDHGRCKRGLQNERYIDSSDEGRGHPDLQLSNDELSPLEAAMFSDQLERLLSTLSSSECEVLSLKLQNHTNDEIANQLQCSERTVRRLSSQIRQRWTAVFESTD